MNSATLSTAAMPGARKAAILLVMLGEEAATTICQHLAPELLQRVMNEVRKLGRVTPEMAAPVLEECHLMLNQQGAGQDGAEFAARLMTKAFGEERARDFLRHLSEEESAGLEYLERAEPEQLAKILEGESPQTIALVLAHLGPRAAPAVALLPEQTRAEAMRRLAGLNQYSMETARKILHALNRKISAIGASDRCSYGGARAVADLLNKMGPAVSKSILESIESHDPKQAVDIRNLMFTFEDLVTVPENGIRELLSQLDKKTLAIALKGSSEEVRNHIFKSMSSRAVEMLKEDMDALGPVRVRDAEQAKQEAVAVVRKLEAEGKISLKSEGDEYVV